MAKMREAIHSVARKKTVIFLHKQTTKVPFKRFVDFITTGELCLRDIFTLVSFCQSCSSRHVTPTNK